MLKVGPGEDHQASPRLAIHAVHFEMQQAPVAVQAHHDPMLLGRISGVGWWQ